MKFITNKTIGFELKTELEKGFNIGRISRWAYSFFYNHTRDLNEMQRNIMEELSRMEDDPQFEYSEKELKRLSELLINEEEDPLKKVNEMKNKWGHNPMTNKQIRLHFNEFWSLLNIFNEVCHGINIKNFEDLFKTNKQTIKNLSKKISDKQKNGESNLEEDDGESFFPNEKGEILLELNDLELFYLRTAFSEVFRQIEESEFQTRIGITIKEAKHILEKITGE